MSEKREGSIMSKNGWRHLWTAPHSKTSWYFGARIFFFSNEMYSINYIFPGKWRLIWTQLIKDKKSKPSCQNKSRWVNEFVPAVAKDFPYFSTADLSVLTVILEFVASAVFGSINLPKINRLVGDVKLVTMRGKTILSC